MIGGGPPPGSSYELTRWARRMVRDHGLKPRDALILYALASYADPRDVPVVAYPSLKTIAEDCGYTVKRRTRLDGRGRERTSWECSTVRAALDSLRAAQIIWTTYHGRGSTARHELFYRPLPADSQEGSLPASGPEGDDALPSALAVLPASGPAAEEPGEKSQALPTANYEEPEMPASDKAGIEDSDQEGNDNDQERERIRSIAVASIRSAA